MASIKIQNFLQLAKRFNSFVKSIEMEMSEEKQELFMYQSYLTILNQKWYNLKLEFSKTNTQSVLVDFVESLPGDSTLMHEAHDSAQNRYKACRATIFEHFSVVRNSTTDPFWLDCHQTLIDEWPSEISNELDSHDNQSHEKKQPCSPYDKKPDASLIHSSTKLL